MYVYIFYVYKIQKAGTNNIENKSTMKKKTKGHY